MNFKPLFFAVFFLIGCESDRVSFQEILVDDSFKYTRHEYHHLPEQVKGRLLTFVYDIPYFGACGVFPPFQIANQIFSSGGGDGGMSPGTSWVPFQITKITYAELIKLVRKTDPDTLKSQSRFFYIKFIEDHSFDSISDHLEWMDVVCNKHRARYRFEMTKDRDK